jgi:predicted nucleic acid-binding protein
VKVLLDTNVILDVWLARKPFCEDSANLLTNVETRELEGYLCPTTITTLHYLVKPKIGS